MRDLCLCADITCPLARHCKRSPRSGTIPHAINQPWSVFVRRADDTCDSYIPQFIERRYEPLD
jgi:hypothetical protein